MATTAVLGIQNDLAVGTPTDPTGWGNVVADALEAITAGRVEVDVSGTSPITLSAAQYACPLIVLIGTITGNKNVEFPVHTRRWRVVNSTSGNFSVTCKTSAGTGVTILQGGVRDIWSDGTNILGAPHAISGTIAIDPASISANTTGLTTFSLPGALTTDYVEMNLPASFETGLVFGGAFVSASGTVSVRIGNVTTGAIDGASRTWMYRLIRH